MGIRFACSECSQVLDVKVELAGKRGLCPNCKNKLSVPTASQISDAEYKLLKESHYRGKQSRASATVGVTSQARNNPAQTVAAKAESKQPSPAVPLAGLEKASTLPTSGTVEPLTAGPLAAGTAASGSKMQLSVEFVQVETETTPVEPDADSTLQPPAVSAVPAISPAPIPIAQAPTQSPNSTPLPEQFASEPVMIEPFEVEMEEPKYTKPVAQTPPSASNSSANARMSADSGSGSGSGTNVLHGGNGSSGSVLDNDKLWYVRPPSGGQFGPASSHLLKKWMREGRVSSRAYVWQDGWPDWRLAGEVLSEYSNSDIAIAANSGVLAPNNQIQSGSTQSLEQFQDSSALRAKISRKKRRQATIWITAMVVGMMVLIGLVILMIILIGNAR